MQLIDQFRVLGPDGTQHTVACYGDGQHRPSSQGCDVAEAPEFRLNGCRAVARMDDETFVTEQGQVLRRVR